MNKFESRKILHSPTKNDEIAMVGRYVLPQSLLSPHTRSGKKVKLLSTTIVPVLGSRI